MAKISQCVQCDHYQRSHELCRKEWKLVEFNDTECEFFGKNETVKTIEVDIENKSELLNELTPNAVPLLEQSTDQCQRHGCVTAWLLFTAIVSSFIILAFLILSFVPNPDEERLSENLGYFFYAGLMLTAVILLYRWNVWGLYIVICMGIYNILAAIFIDGKLDNGLWLLGVMLVAFNMEAKDGYTFFDRLGLTSRRKRVQKRLQSHYINNLMRKTK